MEGEFEAQDIARTVCSAVTEATGYRITGERCESLPFVSLKNKQLKKCAPNSMA